MYLNNTATVYSAKQSQRYTKIEFVSLQKTRDMTDDFKRLPKCVKPVHYDVFIRANFETFKFTGTVVVEADVLEPTKEIRMNCADIEIESVTVNGEPATHE